MLDVAVGVVVGAAVDEAVGERVDDAVDGLRTCKLPSTGSPVTMMDKSVLSMSLTLKSAQRNVIASSSWPVTKLSCAVGATLAGSTVMVMPLGVEASSPSLICQLS